MRHDLFGYSARIIVRNIQCFCSIRKGSLPPLIRTSKDPRWTGLIEFPIAREILLKPPFIAAERLIIPANRIAELTINPRARIIDDLVFISYI